MVPLRRAIRLASSDPRDRPASGAGMSVARGGYGGSQMDDAGFRIVAAAEARRILTDGDVRSDVAFQNDVNRLIATLEELLDRDARYDGAARNVDSTQPGG